jgi:hypothetical protein
MQMIRDDEVMVISAQQVATAVLAYAIQCCDWPSAISAKVRSAYIGDDPNGDPLIAAYLAPVHTLDDMLDVVDSIAPELMPERTTAPCIDKCDAVLATLLERLNIYDLDYINSQISQLLDDAIESE